MDTIQNGKLDIRDQSRGRRRRKGSSPHGAKNFLHTLRRPHVHTPGGSLSHKLEDQTVLGTRMTSTINIHFEQTTISLPGYPVPHLHVPAAELLQDLLRRQLVHRLHVVLEVPDPLEGLPALHAHEAVVLRIQVLPVLVLHVFLQPPEDGEPRAALVAEVHLLPVVLHVLGATGDAGEVLPADRARPLPLQGLGVHVLLVLVLLPRVVEHVPAEGGVVEEVPAADGADLPRGALGGHEAGLDPLLALVGEEVVLENFAGGGEVLFAHGALFHSGLAVFGGILFLYFLPPPTPDIFLVGFAIHWPASRSFR